MTDWLSFKGLGPWNFTPQGDKPHYNEATSISDSTNPIWTNPNQQVGNTPITPNEHDPWCGYWKKNYTLPGGGGGGGETPINFAFAGNVPDYVNYVLNEYIDQRTFTGGDISTFIGDSISYPTTKGINGLSSYGSQMFEAAFIFDNDTGETTWLSICRNIDYSQVWYQSYKPVGNTATAQKVTVDESGVYTVGDLNTGRGNFRIEKRNRADGTLIVEATESKGITITDVMDVLVTTDAVYDVYEYVITNTPGSPGIFDTAGVIQKRDKTTLAVIWEYTYNPHTDEPYTLQDSLRSLGYDGSYIYTTACQYGQGTQIMRFDASGSYITLDGTHAGVIDVDSTGYVTGSLTTAYRYDLMGTLLWSTAYGATGNPTRVRIGNTYTAISMNQVTPSDSYEMIFDSGGNKIFYHNSGSFPFFISDITVVRGSAPSHYTLTPTSAHFTKTGGMSTFTVTADTGYSWTATASSTWIHTASTGTGNGIVNYRVDANSAGERTGTITIGDQTFTITQGGTVVIKSTVSYQTLIYRSTWRLGINNVPPYDVTFYKLTTPSDKSLTMMQVLLAGEVPKPYNQDMIISDTDFGSVENARAAYNHLFALYGYNTPQRYTAYQGANYWTRFEFSGESESVQIGATDEERRTAVGIWEPGPNPDRNQTYYIMVINRSDTNAYTGNVLIESYFLIEANGF